MGSSESVKNIEGGRYPEKLNIKLIRKNPVSIAQFINCGNYQISRSLPPQPPHHSHTTSTVSGNPLGNRPKHEGIPSCQEFYVKNGEEMHSSGMLH